MHVVDARLQVDKVEVVSHVVVHIASRKIGVLTTKVRVINALGFIIELKARKEVIHV